MNNALLALAPVGTWGIVEWLICIIIVCAAIGITRLALQYFGVEVPAIIWRIAMICVIAVIAIIAIKFIVSIL